MWCLEASIIQVLGKAQSVSLCCAAMKVSTFHSGQIASAAGGSAEVNCVTDPAVTGHPHTISNLAEALLTWSYSRV